MMKGTRIVSDDSTFVGVRVTNHANVVAEVPALPAAQVDAVSNYMLKLLDVAAPKNLNMLFVLQQGYGGGLDRLYVTDMESGVKLGRITMDWYGRDIVYALTSDRIEKQAVRSSFKKTGSPEKASNIIRKMFKLPSMAEWGDKMLKEGVVVVSNAFSLKQHSLRTAYDMMMFKMRRHILDNWQEFLPHLQEAGALTAEVKELPEQYAEFLALQEMDKHLDVRGRSVVYNEKSDVYLVTKNSARDGTKTDVYTKADVYTADQLPERIRLCLGMLKLVEPRQILTDYGVKLNTNSFFIIDEENTNE